MSKRLFKTMAASPTLDLTVTGVFLSIPSWVTFTAIPNFPVFLLCSFRSWKIISNPLSPERASHSVLPKDFFIEISINPLISVSSVEERVGIVGNECTLGLHSYPSSLVPNLHLAGPGIHERTGSASLLHGSEKTPFSVRALPVGHHTGTISCSALIVSHRLQRFCSILAGDSIHLFTLRFIQERARL